MLWLIIGAMTLIALFFMLRPLYVWPAAADIGALHDLEVYRQQLAEIDAEVARGTLGSDAAQAARTEIERRMLRASAQAEGGEIPDPARGRRGRRAAALCVIVAVPAIALPLYLHLGSPGMPSAIYADRPHNDGATVQQAQILAMVAKLAQHLKAKPDDVRGWTLLGRSDVVLRDYAGAVAAYRAAARLAPDDADITMAFGEAQVYAAKGDVTPGALKAFRQTLTLAPHHPGALYYVALAKAQGGDLAGALKDWQALYAASPADAAWMSMLRGQIRSAAQQLHLDPDQAVPKPKPPLGAAAGATGPDGVKGTAGAAGPATSGAAAGPGPSVAEVEAVKKMTPAEQAQMIAGMVGRLADHLAADPKDFTGWMRLGQAYDVLGHPDKAAKAFASAAALAPRDPKPLTREALALAAAAGATGATGTTGATGAAGASAAAKPVPASARALFRQALALDPGNEAALWYLGLDAQAAGDPHAARRYWEKLLTRLDPKSADYAEVKGRIDALGVKGTRPGGS